jgi:transcription antitermination factor NusG
MDKFNAGWYVMYTKTRHEKRVVDQLEELQIQSFLPVVKTLRVWSDRKKYIDMPLFPSYVFVNLQDDKSYYDSLEITGILHYVRSGKTIARVRDSIIHNIKLIISQEDGNIEVSSEYLSPGKTVYIKEGPFTGFCCEVIEHKGKQKILVRIELLQRSILLDLPVEYLMPALSLHE